MNLLILNFLINILYFYNANGHVTIIQWRLYLYIFFQNHNPVDCLAMVLVKLLTLIETFD